MLHNSLDHNLEKHLRSLSEEFKSAVLLVDVNELSCVGAGPGLWRCGCNGAPRALACNGDDALRFAQGGEHCAFGVLVTGKEIAGALTTWIIGST